MQPINRAWLAADPRGKLVLAIFFSIISVLPLPLSTQALFLGVALGFCLLAGIKPLSLLQRCLLVNLFMVFVWLALPWRLQYNEGQWLFSFHAPALWLALSITLKCNAIFFAWLGLLWGLGLNRILQALACWKLSSKLLALFFLFCRFTWLLKQEYTVMRRAMLARGFKAKLSWHVLRSLAQLMASLLLRALDRAEKVHQAMLCRGYQGEFYFSHELSWQKADSLIFSLSLAAMALAGACGYLII